MFRSHSYSVSSLLMTLLVIYSASSRAEDYYWRMDGYGQYTGTPIEICRAYLSETPKNVSIAKPETARFFTLTDTIGRCRYTYIHVSGVVNTNAETPNLIRRGNRCTAPATYDPETGTCTPSNSDDCNPINLNCLTRAEKGPPDFCPTPYAGNPINFSIGNKFQEETDYHSPGNLLPKSSRSYNSIDGLWRHNYSTHLRTTESTQTIALVTASGKEFFYMNDGNTITSASANLGILSKTSTGWQFVSSDNERFTFDTAGKLTHWSNTQGYSYQLVYSDNQITVTDNLGNSLALTEDADHQPLSLTAPGVNITYSYNANNRLTLVNRATGGQTTQRQYHYEVVGKPDLLTGITDERGVRYATWAYDDQGRAISSEHADGADKVTVAYNSDGTVSVTNELGRVATYSFQTIRGVRRITSIEGEPSPNCPNSNSTFTYDDRGLLKTKTDNKGNVTNYDYNERGLEISRTEASGTPQARTTTTQWHQDWFLPTAVTELGRTIQYSYDNHGRQTSLSVIQAIP